MKLTKGKPNDVGMSSEGITRVKGLARNWVDEGITSALVILAARKGVIVLHEAYGKLSPKPDSAPLLLDTIFPLDSITKPVTATAAMILVEDGLLGLNRPVSEYLPEFSGEGKEVVLVHHLITHTAGLNDDEIVKHMDEIRGSVEISIPEWENHPITHEELILGISAPLWNPPGGVMYYSNFGFRMLGEIIQRVSRQSLASFSREKIFKPLEMKDTSFGLEESLEPRVVRRQDNSSENEVEIWRRRGTATEGCFSTAYDLAVFGQMLLNGGRYGNIRILSPASVSEMTRNQLVGIQANFLNEVFPEAGWGFGWSVKGNKKSKAYAEPLQSSQTFSHGGGSGVFIWVDPVTELVGVYFSVDLGFEYKTGHDWNADLFVNAVTASIIES